MNKDKEWFKQQIVKNYPSQSEIDNPDYEIIAKVKIIDEVLSLINQLDEPELPVIPQFVASAIEKTRETRKNISISNIFYEVTNSGFYTEIVDSWILSNSNLFAIVWLSKDGYTIDKVKRYRVQLPDAESNASSNLLGLMKTGDSRIVICKIKFNTFLYSDNVRLTEQEIKRNHEYLWAFAEEVPNV